MQKLSHLTPSTSILFNTWDRVYIYIHNILLYCIIHRAKGFCLESNSIFSGHASCLKDNWSSISLSNHTKNVISGRIMRTYMYVKNLVWNRPVYRITCTGTRMFCEWKTFANELNPKKLSRSGKDCDVIYTATAYFIWKSDQHSQNYIIMFDACQGNILVIRTVYEYEIAQGGLILGRVWYRSDLHVATKQNGCYQSDRYCINQITRFARVYCTCVSCKFVIGIIID